MTGEPTTTVETWRERLVEALREDLGSADTERVSPVPGVGRLEVLGFQLGAETYAVDIGEVAEILLPRPVTPLPRTPPWVLGVVSLRGAVLPVLDLGRYLGLDGACSEKGARILVLKDGEEWVGFWVDRVRGVMRFSEEEVEATEFAVSVDPRFLKGIGYDRHGDLVAVLSASGLCDFHLENP